jgi:hypothetical protein
MGKHVVSILIFGAVLAAATLAAAKDLDSTPAQQPSTARQDQVADSHRPAQSNSALPQPKGTDDALATVHQRLCNASDFSADLARMIDTNKDGKITRQELDDFARAAMKADANGKGYFTSEDAMAAANKDLRRRFMRSLSNKYDKDKDNSVSMAELGADAGKYKSLDVNHDGVIDARDFEVIGEKASVAVRDHQMRVGAASASPARPLWASPAAFVTIPTADGGGGASAGAGAPAGGTGIGTTGATGMSATGATGMGDAGATGMGDLGATGMGDAGATGMGDTGATGLGDAGATGIGDVGATGIGDTGATGLGDTGATGMDQTDTTPGAPSTITGQEQQATAAQEQAAADALQSMQRAQEQSFPTPDSGDL